jgi:hypothetical protein
MSGSTGWMTAAWWATSVRLRRRTRQLDHAGPGGVGPMTVATLMQNTLEAADAADASSVRARAMGRRAPDPADGYNDALHPTGSPMLPHPG